jgi:NADP-dependent 3-hydroxy acid dehydrogenase YdfG
MTNIEGRVAVITGAGRGIGRAIALDLAQRGARVALAARGVAGLEEAARMIGKGASVISTDVRKRDEVHRLFEEVSSSLGPIDILVNAAGVGVFGLVADFSDGDYDAILDTNLRGIFFTCRDVFAFDDFARAGRYCQHCVHCGQGRHREAGGLLRIEVRGYRILPGPGGRGPGAWIRVSVVCPGSTDSSFSQDPNREGKTRSKMLSPADVAHAVRMIVTQEPNSFISEIVLRPTRKP